MLSALAMSYAVLATSAAPGGSASAAYRVTLEDPAGDDRGPGTYVPPSGSFYGRGTFDLRSFEVRVEGRFVVFEVGFGEHIRRPHQVRRTHARTIDLDNGIYLQNVDIYIDIDGSPLTGTSEAIPGRNVVIDPTARWDKAVLITPQPALARTIMDGWKHGHLVHAPASCQSLGPKVTCRVPTAELGQPAKHWGYVVMVSGAIWEETFDAAGRLLGEHAKNVLTMPVMTVPEDQIFGGGDLHGLDPWVVDIITPPGVSQSRILTSFDVKAKTLARVPMVYPFPKAKKAHQAALPALPKVAPASPPPEQAADGVLLKVKDVQKDMVVLAGDHTGVKQFTLGTVLDSEGQAVAQVVVTAVYPKFVLATAVEGADAILVGAAVRFDTKKEEMK